MRPSERNIRIAAALIFAAGLAAAGISILAEELGLGAEAAEGIFGWKRVTLLAFGAALIAIGALLFARPGIASRVVDFDHDDPVARRVRIAAALIFAAGLAAAGISILAEELGLGAEAAEGVFGWKRITLLAFGGALAAVGGVLFARPAILSHLVNWERLGARRVRTSRYLGPVLEPSDRRLRYLAVGLLALLGLVLMWTRLIHIDQSFWHDEVYTVANFSGVGPGAILFSGFHFNNHVLYSLASWATVGVLGESEAMYRLWSVLPGIAAIAIAAWWVWGRIGRVAAVAFTTIAVAGPLHLEYVPQARGYGLALLAATLTLVAADHLTRAYSRRALLGFVCAGLLGIWTLITFTLAYVGQALALLRWRQLRLPVTVAVGATGLLSLAFYAPTLGAATAAAGSGVSGTTVPLHAALLLDRPLEWLVIPTVSLLTGEERAGLPGTGVIPDASWGNWVDVGVFALLVLGIVALWRRGDGGLALILVLPPLFFNVALSLDQQATVTRHQLFLLPYVVTLVATGIAEIGLLVARQRFLKPIAIAIGVIGVLALSQAIVEEQEGTLPYENFKQVASIVQGSGIETVVTDSAHPTGLRYYLGDELIVVPSEELAQLLCAPERQGVVYVHHRRFSNPYASPRAVECAGRKPLVRVQVPQRARGFSIDVWVIDPRARGGMTQGQ